MQFVFETHNSNIPVLGDAERIFMVEYQDTKIDISQGNIDLKKTTHKQIVDIMEGGEEAFDKKAINLYVMEIEYIKHKYEEYNSFFLHQKKIL